jgi:hypothetical protein
MKKNSMVFHIFHVGWLEDKFSNGPAQAITKLSYSRDASSPRRRRLNSTDCEHDWSMANQQQVVHCVT